MSEEVAEKVRTTHRIEALEEKMDVVETEVKRMDRILIFILGVASANLGVSLIQVIAKAVLG